MGVSETFQAVYMFDEILLNVKKDDVLLIETKFDDTGAMLSKIVCCLRYVIVPLKYIHTQKNKCGCHIIWCAGIYQHCLLNYTL